MSSPLDGDALWRGRLAAHRQHLWNLCYRMTGSASDADDLVQETFRRALESPPPDVVRDARPWLVRIAVNLSRDALRERRRRGYVGTWLPTPIETGTERDPGDDGETAGASAMRSAEDRYGDFESLSFEFLVMLESLTPSQRAVLVLRDVFEYSVDETAAALSMSAASVKTTLHRARRAAGDAVEHDTPPPSPELARRTRRALEAFCIHLAAGNVSALESLLASDVRARNDGSGEFFAARKPIVGIAKVIKFHRYVLRRTRMRVAMRAINGLPALVVETAPVADPRIARRFVVRVELDAHGRIALIDAVTATEKLRAIDFESLREPRLRDFVRPVLAAATTPPPQAWLPAATRRLAWRAWDGVRAVYAARTSRSS